MSLQAHPLVGDWLAVRDGRLVVRTGKVDIGQRISSALAQIAHEELTLPLGRIEVAPVTTAGSPDEGMTSGSNSVEQSGRAVRLAAATLRALVIARAGGEGWTLAEGMLTGPGTNRPLPLLDLVEPEDFEARVDPDAVSLGAEGLPAAPMRGIGEMVRGAYAYVHDLEVPGMRHARVVRPPHDRARLAEVPEAAVERAEAEGLSVIRDGSFLAVAGEREWPVVQAAARLAAACRWEGVLPEGDVFALLTRENAVRLPVEDGTPRKAPVPPDLPGVTHAARYERPFTMHGALAPSAALATWDGARLEIVTHSQGIYVLRESIAESLGLPVEAVVLTHAPGSGCYGHNGADDAAYEAALVARAMPGVPVLLKWSREDEHGWEPYGTAQAVEIAARVEGERIAAVSVEAIGGTYRGRPRAGKDRAGPAKLVANWLRADGDGRQVPTPNMNRQGGLQRNIDPVYDIPETRFVKNLVTDMPLRTSALRCLGAAANVFAIESFVDELARETGTDPIAFRKAHMTDPRAVAVLERLEAAVVGWPEGAAGRGIAYAQYKNAMTRVGVAVDIDVSDAAEVRLIRAVLVADAGRVVDRDGLTAQIEGGFMQAASWALCEEVTWDREGVTSRDWDSYPVLRFDNVPEIAVVLVEPPGAPSVGAGEASPGPTLAAIANALCDATGLRMRRLPMTADAITRAALEG